MTLSDVAWPMDAGKRLRSAAMVREVATRCNLDVIVLFADADPDSCPVPPDVSARWEIVPPRPRTPIRAAIGCLLRLVPWQIGVQDWSEVRLAVGARGVSYDLVWFGALDHFAQLGRSVHGRTTVVDCDDVETEKLRRFLALPDSLALPRRDRLQRRLELPLWGRIQRRAVASADAVLVCSELDRIRLAAQAAKADSRAAARIVSVPNTYPQPTDVHTRRPIGACTLVVVANYGTDQNVDAASFAAKELLPVLRRVVPGARIRLVGRRIDRVSNLEGIDGLDLVGPVGSVSAELAQAHAVLVPIRFGGGTRLKVVEAFAYGVPVISTRAGAEGIDADDGKHLLLADTPTQIAAAVQRLLTERELPGQLSVAGLDLYDRKYRPQAAADAIGAILERLLGSGDERLGTAVAVPSRPRDRADQP
jgi:glycosyltransferase involved in cell wall biosynthesis